MGLISSGCCGGRIRLAKQASLTHSYPFCWRSNTPLIYRAVPSWFVKVGRGTEEMANPAYAACMASSL